MYIYVYIYIYIYKYIYIYIKYTHIIYMNCAAERGPYFSMKFNEPFRNGTLLKKILEHHVVERTQW